MEPKQGRIDEQSEIYNHTRADGYEKGSFNKMSLKDKIQFFKDYFLKYTIIGIVFIIIAVIVISGLNRKNKTQTIYIGLINGIYMEPNSQDEYLDSLWDYMTKDSDYMGAKNRNRMYITSYADAYEDEMQLSGDYDSKRLDVVFMSKTSFDSYVSSGQLYNLKDIVSEELIDKISSNAVISSSQQNGNEIYGISINSDILKLYDNTGKPYENVVMAVMINSKRTKAAGEYIKFLFR